MTEAQHRDILRLRSLFYAKLGALARDRRALLVRVPSGAIESALHASSRLDEVVQTAQEIQDNSTQELRTYKQFSSAFCRGVTSVVWAWFCMWCHSASSSAQTRRTVHTRRSLQAEVVGQVACMLHCPFTVFIAS